MAENYKNWKTALATFLENAEKELAEIRRSKAELLKMKSYLMDEPSKGQYHRDDECIIISAPKIIIGNVDSNGNLIDGSHSEVVIRSNTIRQEGVGNEQGQFGTVITKASKIQNVCIDPGIDGKENVVGDTSLFTVQAQGIALRSEQTSGAFTQNVYSPTGCISLNAEKQISIDSMVPCENRSKQLEESISEKKQQIKDLLELAKTRKESVDGIFDKLEEYSNSGSDFYENEISARSSYLDIDNLHELIKFQSHTLYQALDECVDTISSLAELNREVKCLEKKKEEIDGYKDSYKKELTGASVEILAERTNIISVDGDYNLRDNNGAGLTVQAHDVNFLSNSAEGGRMEDSTFIVNCQDIQLSTADKTEADGSKDIPALGSVCITSKDIQLESVDYEDKDNTVAEKALTAGGSIKMRAETMQVGSYDTEGNAAGSFCVNSKSIKLAAMDVDKESRTDKQLAKGSAMLLLADKMYVGSKDKTNQSASLQVSSDKVGVFAKTTAEIQQNEGKATVQLDGGNVAIGGSKAEIYGESTVNGKTTFKGDVEIPKVTIDNVEVKTSFKSPHLSDGISVQGASASNSLSAKLTEEEVLDQTEN